MNLKEYIWKDVKLIDIDGKEWIGRVTGYEYPDENEEGKECIDFRTRGQYFGFYIDEIKSIEEIE